MTLILIGVLTFLINLPFGYWRSRVKKFSIYWFMAIHLSVPLVYGLRTFAGIGWHFSTFSVLAGSFFLGQFVGSRLFINKL